MDWLSELASRRIMLQDMNYNEANIIGNFREYIYNNGTYTENEIDEIIQNFYIALDIEVDPRLINSGYEDSGINSQEVINNEFINIINTIINSGNNSDENSSSEIISATVSSNGSLVFFVRQRNSQELEDVKVTLDDKELEKIESKILDKKIDDNCSICLEPYKEGDDVSILICSHIFHKNCIEPYFKEYSHKCPNCKQSAGIGKPKI